MNLFNLLAIAIGLSMDAFAVSICKGLCQKKMSWKSAIIIGLSFGIFQAGMPVIGYVLGAQFRVFIDSVDHWVAFLLLLIIGLNMINEAKQTKTDEEVACNIDGELVIDYKELFTLSVATSIDALAVGFSFALMKIDLLQSVCLIGSITFTLSTLGVYIGFKFGSRFKSLSETLGGIILILIGLKILIEGLL